VKAEGLLFREEEAKSFCLFALDGFWPSPLDGELPKGVEANGGSGRHRCRASGGTPVLDHGGTLHWRHVRVR
jgi:hypothetical protein